MALGHLQGDYSEVLMLSVYVFIYFSKNKFSCRRLASESFFLIFLGKRENLSSVTLKTYITFVMLVTEGF